MNQAENVVVILNAFQDAGWPKRIDDPLDHASKAVRQQRLGDAVRSLKRNLVAITFRRDGAEGIRWERASIATP
jgi:hypothetical protein